MSRDQFVQIARATPFDIVNTSIRNSNLQDVIQELRRQTVYDPEFTVTTTSGVLILTSTNSTLHFITGSAIGFTVRLPSALTLFRGQVYVVVNESTASINIQDSAGNFLFEVLADSIATIYLQGNSTVDGIWVGYTVSGFATGILSYNITTQTPFSTSSVTDVLITGFAVTPVAGTYGVWYSADIQIDTNNRIADCTIYKAGVAVGNTNREMQGNSSNFQTSQQTLGIISVNGSETIDVRVASSGGNITIGNRSLLLIRLGPP
jgi:hypothetical protein